VCWHGHLCDVGSLIVGCALYTTNRFRTAEQAARRVSQPKDHYLCHNGMTFLINTLVASGTCPPGRPTALCMACSPSGAKRTSLARMLPNGGKRELEHIQGSGQPAPHPYKNEVQNPLKPCWPQPGRGPLLLPAYPAPTAALLLIHLSPTTGLSHILLLLVVNSL
jgi:hypothetical protein